MVSGMYKIATLPAVARDDSEVKRPKSRTFIEERIPASHEGEALSLQKIATRRSRCPHVTKDACASQKDDIRLHQRMNGWITMKMQNRVPSSLRYALLAAATIAVIAWVISRGPMPQDQTYHRFADSKPFAGVPNFMDTATNLAFLALGIWGCAAVAGLRKNRDVFREDYEALPYFVFFGGMCLIAAGSMYYHLTPRNWTLLWDRLPMTVSFMAFFSIIIGERFGARAGRIALPVLVIIGIASAAYWYLAETWGRGDLRFYVLVQFYPIAIIPLASILVPSRYSKGWVFTLVIAVYAGAKLLEVHDLDILRATGGSISGHSLKHLLAAAAPLPLVWMLKGRTRITT